ncbi:MAG: pyrroline-5-carboxylate reductase [Candidatus Bathyarchaeia archaeon]
MVSEWKIAVLGAGKMGEALINGLLRSGKVSTKDIQAVEVIKERSDFINRTYGIECSSDLARAIERSEILIMAVKPHDVGKLLENATSNIKSSKIIVSIAAGVRIETFAKYLPSGVPIVRVMPNLACFVGQGMMAMCPGPFASDEVLNRVRSLLELAGRVEVMEEKYFDAVTGLVGSGPAYVYSFIEGLADAGVRQGLPRDKAVLLSAQTVLGASSMVAETKEHPAKLRDMVVTPAGTTIEGLLVLERGGLKALLVEAVTKATQRAKELMPS